MFHSRRGQSPHQLQRPNAIESSGKDSSDEEAMLRHNHHLVGSPMTPPPPLMPQQKFYHYAGPPAIQMSTWQDRSIPGNSNYSSPVPPPVSRMAAGYHSLQYGEVGPHLGHRDVKYTRDAADDVQRAQVCCM